MENITKLIEINNKYYVKITYKNDRETRLYTLYNSNDIELETSFNRDSFLLKARKHVRITCNQECLIASI